MIKFNLIIKKSFENYNKCGISTTTTRRVYHKLDSVARKSFTKKIVENTEISTEHLTPEISLRLITSKCEIYHQPVRMNCEKIFPNDPFWGFYWPGGQAISRYILDNPKLCEDKRILDVGSGSGACSIAAIKCKAKYSVANDIDEVAGIAVQINADLNQVNHIKICTRNLIGLLDICEDIILLGDVFYDTELADVLIPWLQKLRQQNKIILIGDPGRHALATTNHLKLLNKLITYELTENCCIENNGFKFVNVWKFQ